MFISLLEKHRSSRRYSRIDVPDIRIGYYREKKAGTFQSTFHISSAVLAAARINCGERVDVLVDPFMREVKIVKDERGWMLCPATSKKNRAAIVGTPYRSAIIIRAREGGVALRTGGSTVAVTNYRIENGAIIFTLPDGAYVLNDTPRFEPEVRGNAKTIEAQEVGPLTMQRPTQQGNGILRPHRG